MRHYRFKLLKLLFLAMLCCSGLAFGQSHFFDTGPDCEDGFYFGSFISTHCSDYGASYLGYFPVSASAYWGCGYYEIYVGAFADVYAEGEAPDVIEAHSELAYNAEDPGFDYGYEQFSDADGEGYSEGGGFFVCAFLGP